MTNPLAADLRAALPSLNDSDRKFANSLLSGFERYKNFSVRQLPYVEKLIERAKNPQPVVAAKGGLSAIVDLFKDARAKGLKHPKVWLQLKDGQDIRLSVAGEASRNPGTINVTDGGSFHEGTWFGRVAIDGTWQPSPRGEEPPTLYTALTCLAADPARTAAAHGQRTGACSFCSRPLEDARSVAVGYGPICATKWGLPWGEETLPALPKNRVGTKANPIKVDKAEPKAKRSRVSPMLKGAQA
jgi:hypothetical protein